MEKTEIVEFFGFFLAQIHSKSVLDGLMYWRLSDFYNIFILFPMAKIRRIGHDHQAPFILLLGRIKRWHEAKTSCHMNNIPRTPKIFTDSEPPIKWIIGGLIRGAPTPLTPIMGWAKLFFLGGYDWWTVLTPIESNIFLANSWPQIYFQLILGIPPTPRTLTPLDPFKWGGRNGGVIMRGLI